MSRFKGSLTAGYECLVAWSDLLDRINVFPVADNDTGTNLRVSLAPLRVPVRGPEKMRDQLARSATGNSGNIAVAFFRELCTADRPEDLGGRIAYARERAYKAVAQPQKGTMLSFFDALAASLPPGTVGNLNYLQIMSDLQRAVAATTSELPDLDRAGVVDSGALGMYIFFDGFFRNYLQYRKVVSSVVDLFAGRLAMKDSFIAEPTSDHCIEAVIQTDMDEEEAGEKVAALGESVVVIPEKNGLKVHVHSSQPQQLRKELQGIGELTRWSDEKITGKSEQNLSSKNLANLHIVTDAAASMTRETAESLGITLLDSYIVVGDAAKPESLCSPEHIYASLKKGQKVTTAQASTYERHQHYASICRQFGDALYLCVGSAFTGNYQAASAWKKNYDRKDQFTVIDSGAASGRLALIALLTAQEAQRNKDVEQVKTFARTMVAECVEYVFIDELKYLVAGGRVSRAKGFFGDLMRMKPVISPTAEGVQKVGVVRNRAGQLDFGLKQLTKRFSRTNTPVILLQYSNNADWVKETVAREIQTLLPGADIMQTPLSLTSGVHMGPGTWSLAFVPEAVCSEKPALSSLQTKAR